jgi:hypothetical protein
MGIKRCGDRDGKAFGLPVKRPSGVVRLVFGLPVEGKNRDQKVKP